METLTTNPTTTKRTPLSFTATLIITGLIAGTLDILAAIFLLANGHAAAVFKFIASAAFGRAAAKGGADMIIAGAFFHYFIAFCWVGLYFIAYNHVSLLRKNVVFVTVCYGLFVWLVMNMIVVPMTHIGHKAGNPVMALVNAIILMICIALPAVWMRNLYEMKKQPIR